MKDTITLAELRKTELYRKEQTRPLREFLMENIDVLKLADEVEMWGRDLLALNMKGGVPVIEGARLIRQQQAELDAFKLQYYNTGYSIQLRDKDETIRQQQAEIAELKHMNKNWQISENILLLELEKLQHRELTDEEILDLASYAGENPTKYDMIDFARAILRKAQEK
jgi:hypothetical protein